MEDSFVLSRRRGEDLVNGLGEKEQEREGRRVGRKGRWGGGRRGTDGTISQPL